MRTRVSWIFAGGVVGLIFATPSADAYIGPGMGLGGLGVLLGFLLSIVLAIIGFFWYPFKRLLRRKKRSQKPKEKE